MIVATDDTKGIRGGTEFAYKKGDEVAATHVKHLQKLGLTEVVSVEKPKKEEK